jgi:hypothetical protein
VAEVIWRTEDVRPVSAPIVVEGAVVLYTRTGQELFVTAVDPADGTELWSRPATPSQSIRGVGLHLRSVDGSVARAVRLEPELACTSVRVDGSWTTLALAEDGSLRRLPESEAAGWTGIGPLGLSRLEGDGTQVGRVGRPSGDRCRLPDDLT